jgi:hypothetical protein
VVAQRRRPQGHDTAAGLGRAFGYLLIAAGVLLSQRCPGGLWFAVIGFFLVTAASAERVQGQVLATFTGVRARDLMSRPAVTIPSGITLAEAQRYFARYRYTAFPITDSASRAVGVLSIDQLERMPCSRWPTTLVDAVVNRDPALLVTNKRTWCTCSSSRPSSTPVA